MKLLSDELQAELVAYLEAAVEAGVDTQNGRVLLLEVRRKRHTKHSTEKLKEVKRDLRKVKRREQHLNEPDQQGTQPEVLA